METLIARLDSVQESIGKLYHDIELIKLLAAKLDDNFISKTCGDCACYYEEQDYGEDIDGDIVECGTASFCGRTDEFVNADDDACLGFVMPDLGGKGVKPSITQIKRLMNVTGSSVMLCRYALIASDNDFEEAKELIQAYDK